MTENEAISEFDKIICKKMMSNHGISEKQHELYQTAIDALEEIQRYKTLGTVRELNRMKRIRTKRKACLVNPFKTSLEYYCCVGKP